MNRSDYSTPSCSYSKCFSYSEQLKSDVVLVSKYVTVNVSTMAHTLHMTSFTSFFSDWSATIIATWPAFFEGGLSK